MTKPRIISYIAKHLRSALLIATVAQVSVLCLVLPFLSYNDAKERAKFLATSNLNSIAVMMSTGDIFQVQILLNSFVRNETPFATVLDSDDFDIKSRQHSPYQQFIKGSDGLKFTGGKVFALTKTPIFYNGFQVGTLVLLNRVDFTYWIAVSVIIAFFSVFTFWLQNRHLRRVSYKIATNITELEEVLKFHGNELGIDQAFKNLRSSDVFELEVLADKMHKMMNESVMLIRSEKEAAIGRITAHLGHDLRAPLGIFESLRYLPAENLDDVRPKFVAALNKIYAMIDSLRFADSATIVKRSESDLSFSIGMEGVTKMATDAQVTLTIPDQVIPSIFIDHQKVERAWLNLVSNAIEFASTSVVVETVTSGTDLVIRVIDDGPGVPVEFIPKLFQRGATYGKHDGTGLGLAYVRQIMRGHGGDVTYRRENELTIFECVIPNAKAVQKSEENSMISSGLKTGLEFKILLTKVAICTVPVELGDQIRNHLTSLNYANFDFIREYQDADIVVSNDEDTLLRAIEDGKSPIEVKSSIAFDKMISRLEKRFN